MADTNPIKIEQSQAQTWAQELTLKQLMTISTKSNEALEALALKMGVAKDSLSQIETGVFLSNRTADQNAKKAQSAGKDIFDQFGKKSGDNVTALQMLAKSFGSAFTSLSKQMSSADPSSMMGAFSSGLKQNTWYLTQLNGTMPKTILKFAAITEVLVDMSKTVLDVNQNYMQLISNGIKFDDGLQGLNKAAADSGMSMDKYMGIISKFGSVFAQLGSVQITNLSKQFNVLTKNGADLNMTQTEATEGFMDYLEMQRNAGKLMRMTQPEIVAGSKEFLNQMNELSRLTGKSRDDLIKQARDMSKDPMIHTLMAALPPDQQKKLQAGFAQLTAVPDELRERLKTVAVAFASGGEGLANATDHGLTLLAAQSGTQKQFMDLMKAINGNGDLPTALKNFRDGIIQSGVISKENLPALTKAFPELATTFTQVDLAANGLADSLAQADRADKAARDLGYKSAQDLAERDKQRNESIANFNKAFGRLSGAFNDLVIKFMDPILIPAMDYLAKAVDLVSSVFDKVGVIVGPIGESIGYVMNGFSSTLGDTTKGLVGFGAAIAGLVVSVGALRAGFGVIGSLFSIVGLGKGGILSKLPGGKLGGIMGSLGGDAEGGILGKLGAGAGKGIGGFISGIGEALAAIGPKVGQIALGAAAVGAAITLIGAGIAGATWIMGAALPKFAEGLSAFDKINGDNLKSVGAGMEALGVGMLAFGAGEVADAFSAVMNGILKFFGVDNDPIDKLKRFGEIADPLNQAAPALQAFAKAFKDAMGILSSNDLSDGITKGFDQLKDFLGQDFSSLFSSQPKIIGQISQLSDAIGLLSTNIQKSPLAEFAKNFKDSIDILQSASLSDQTFKSLDQLSKYLDNNSVLDKLKTFLGSDQGTLFGGQPKIIGQITELANAISDLVQKTNGLSLVDFATQFKDAADIMQKVSLDNNVSQIFDQIKTMLGSDFSGLFGSQPRVIGQISQLASSIGQLSEKSADLNHVTNITAPTIENTDLQKRTLSFYDNQKMSNEAIIGLLSDIKAKLDTLNETNSDGHDDTVQAIKKIQTGIIF